MTFAQQLGAALVTRLGPLEPTIHTAIPPAHLGGGADVLTFRNAPQIPGVVHVSASTVPGTEIVMCTRAATEWAPRMVSQLAGATRARSFEVHATVPLGDPSSPFGGLLFAYAPQLYPITLGDRYVTFLLAVGITANELAACRSHGTPWVIELLRDANLYPFSEAGRPDAPGIASLGPSPLEREGLSDDARRGLYLVVNALGQEVELARTAFSPSDLAILTAMYGELGAWDQRVELVNLTQDSEGPGLAPMYRLVLRDALAQEIDENTAAHGALAIALAALDGDLGHFDRYWDDLEGALAAARARL